LLAVAADIATALTAALGTALADFGDLLIIVIPVTFGIGVGLLLYRRAKGLVK
jgi:hypothetical protein